jgi:hypothetical protein
MTSVRRKDQYAALVWRTAGHVTIVERSLDRHSLERTDVVGSVFFVILRLIMINEQIPH